MSRSPFRVFPAVFLLLVTGSGPVFAGSADTEGVVPCVISAWSTDRSSMGLAVRAGPDADTPVIARLPSPIASEDHRFAVEVSITGSKNGWFRIDKAILDDYVKEQGPKVVFEGVGWVPGRRLGLLLNDGDLHHGPSESALVVTKLLKDDPGGETHGPDAFVVDRLNACEGDWVEVEGTFLGSHLRGWATGTCANQVTTCP